MIDALADVTVPVTPEEAFAAISDLDHADWLPAVRGLHHIGGPPTGIGARFAVEVGLVGRHLKGILACTEFESPYRFVLSLEHGLDLAITVRIVPVSGGCTVEVEARYSVGGAFGNAVEKASAPAARREVGRAVESFASRFGRKSATPPRSRSKSR